MAAGFAAAGIILIPLTVIAAGLFRGLSSELRRFYFAIDVCGAALFLAVYLLYPRAAAGAERLRHRWRPTWSRIFLAAACAFFAAFIVWFGNRQFGGYDFSILIDTAWRMASGQAPYRDFVCTMPPGFYLGAGYAFEVFGARWDAQLYAAALYACGTFLWLYWLLAALLETRAAAYLTAFAIECAAMLLPSFWWYNNITSIAGCVFFVSCFLYLRRPDRKSACVSYCGSLFLLALMKPNTAGMLGLGGFVLLLAATSRRRRLLYLTLATGAAVVAFLAVNGVTPAQVLASYRAAAVDRGGLTTFGFNDSRPPDILRAALCVTVMSAFLFGLLAQARRARFLTPAAALLLLLGPATSVYGMFSNGELKDVEWTLFFAACALAAFGLRISKTPRAHAFSARFYTALLCSLLASELYMGAVRFRVEGIGYGAFFEWHDASRSVPSAFFPRLKAGGRFQRVIEEVGNALKENRGPIFFGPRMEFAYAAFRVPSPVGLPVWWHPGTAFAKADEPVLLDNWLSRRFNTIIFLKNDFTYYSPAFLSRIDALYSRDERYPELTVFHAKSDAGAQLRRAEALAADANPPRTF